MAKIKNFKISGDDRVITRVRITTDGRKTWGTLYSGKSYMNLTINEVIVEESDYYGRVKLLLKVDGNYDNASDLENVEIYNADGCIDKKVLEVVDKNTLRATLYIDSVQTSDEYIGYIGLKVNETDKWASQYVEHFLSEDILIKCVNVPIDTWGITTGWESGYYYVRHSNPDYDWSNAKINLEVYDGSANIQEITSNEIKIQVFDNGSSQHIKYDFYVHISSDYTIHTPTCPDIDWNGGDMDYWDNYCSICDRYYDGDRCPDSIHDTPTDFEVWCSTCQDYYDRRYYDSCPTCASMYTCPYCGERVWPGHTCSFM